MVADRHFGFVGQILGLPTTRIWWSYVQKLVVIGSVGLIIQKFEYFVRLAPFLAVLW